MTKEIPPQLETALSPTEERVVKLYGLAANLRVAKNSEESVRANRIAVEEMIARLIPGKEDGQVTETLPNGSKIVVKRGFNYNADIKGIESIWADTKLPIGGIMAPIKAKTTWVLDIKGYEWYKKNHPDIFQQLVKYVTVTPKKVTIELKDQKEE